MRILKGLLTSHVLTERQDCTKQARKGHPQPSTPTSVPLVWELACRRMVCEHGCHKVFGVRCVLFMSDAVKAATLYRIMLQSSAEALQISPGYSSQFVVVLITIPTIIIPMHVVFHPPLTIAPNHGQIKEIVETIARLGIIGRRLRFHALGLLV